MAKDNRNQISNAVNSVAYLRALCSLGVLILLCCTVFFFTRLGTWFTYAQPNQLADSHEFWQAMWTGFQFDVAIIIRLGAVGILASILCIPLPVAIANFSWTLNRYLGGLILLMVIWLAMINFTYIGFFNRPIDSFAFSGMNYGAQTIWPTVSSLNAFELRLLICVVATLVMFWLYIKIGKKITLSIRTVTMGRVYFMSLAVILPLLLMAVLSRGSLSTSQLSPTHLVVSSETAINNLVPNGIVAIYYGYQDFRRSTNIEHASDQSGRELFEAFFGSPAADSDLFPQFFTHTEHSALLEKNPPHVVLNLVESMAEALLKPTFSGEINLAGELRQHLETDYYFPRFLPAHDDTQKSLMSLLVNTEHSSISHAAYQHIALQTSVARVFKKAGYKTLFVYSGFEELSNRSEYFKTQGFDEFIGAQRLTELYPGMHNTIWGGEDKFLFDEVYKQLSNTQKGDKPLFIVTLTVTNHPPYKLPLEHSLDLTDIPQRLMSRLQDLPEKSLDTYFYTNDQLGRFISKIKASHLKETTIIAATGDHAVRGMYFNTDERLHEISVPLYLYLPRNYQPSGVVDTQQIASHKDIMPTLYNNALSEASYLNMGRDLLDPSTKQSIHNFAYHADYVLADNKAYRKNWTTFLPGQLVTADFKLTKMPMIETDEPGNGVVYSQVLDWLTRFQMQQSQAERSPE